MKMSQDFISTNIVSQDFRKLGLFYKKFLIPHFFIQKLFSWSFLYRFKHDHINQINFYLKNLPWTVVEEHI